MINLPRQLKPDETYCGRCKQIFVTGEAFSAHETGQSSCDPHVLELHGDVWGWPGKDATRKPRRTQAMAAFDRILAELEYRGQFLSPSAHIRYSNSDVDKVLRALEKARDK